MDNQRRNEPMSRSRSTPANESSSSGSPSTIVATPSPGTGSMSNFGHYPMSVLSPDSSGRAQDTVHTRFKAHRCRSRQWRWPSATTTKRWRNRRFTISNYNVDPNNGYADCNDMVNQYQTGIYALSFCIFWLGCWATMCSSAII